MLPHCPCVGEVINCKQRAQNKVRIEKARHHTDSGDMAIHFNQWREAIRACEHAAEKRHKNDLSTKVLSKSLRDVFSPKFAST